MVLTRRHLLSGISTGLFASALPGVLHAQTTSHTDITDNMVLISGLGGNVLACSIGDSLILVDTGNVRSISSLLDSLDALDGRERVHTVFNTHWHLDQVGGNAYFGGQGANIIAHEKTRQYLSTPYYLFEEKRYQEPVPEAAMPTETIYQEGQMTIAGDNIEYAYLQSAHTNGDIYVRFVNANVIAAGDVVSPEIDPVFDWFSGGWVGGRVDALDGLLDLCDNETVIVPAYGPAIARKNVEAERDFMQYIYDTLVDQIRMGFDYRDSLASGMMDAAPRQLDNPEKFLYDAHKGLWAHHNKLEPNIV